MASTGIALSGEPPVDTSRGAAPARGVTLRGVLSIATLVVTVVALVVAGALVALTTLLHRLTDTMQAAVESVRLAEEAQSGLLLHARTIDPLARREHEAEIRSRVAQARGYVTGAEEAETLTEAESALDDYFERAAPSSDDSPELGRAFRALHALVEINVQQSRDAARSAEAWDARTNVLGAVAAALIVGVAGTLLWWLRARAFRPLLGLAAAMHRFGEGDRQARATERGPRELGEMSERFNEMAAALATQRDAQMAFLAGVAHDLRTPLSALSLSIGTIQPDAPPSPERLRWILGVARRQIDNLTRMIGDLLDVARIEAGNLELSLEACDLRDVAGTVAEWFRADASDRVVVELPDGPVVARCDPLRVEQVIANLLSNALKYSPAPRPVRLSVVREGAEVVIAVADQGIGMTPEALSRVFRPFTRVGSATGSIPGIGLGLFIVRRIVEAHGGRIEASSAPGRGSTFRVRLPLT